MSSIKNYFISLIILITTVLGVNAQTGNAIIFSENGELFTVLLNGIQQNANPLTNIKITNLASTNYSINIVFSDASINRQNFNLAITFGNEITYALHRKINGDYSLRNINEIPLSQAPPTASGQTEVAYTTVPAGNLSNSSKSHGNSTIDVNGNSHNGGAVFGINSMGSGVGISISGVDVVVRNNNNNSGNSNPSDATNPANQQGNSKHYNMPGYDGSIGCPFPISKEDFYYAKATISSNNFEEDKMTAAKKIINNNCLTCVQIKDLMQLFSFEITKLEFAKFAYNFTFDQGNYYTLYDSFVYKATADELVKYINEHNH